MVILTQTGGDNIKKIILFFLVLSLTTVFALALKSNVKSQELTKVEYGCIIRPDANGNWYFLTGNHQAVGCSSISQTSTYVQVNISDPVTKVVTFYSDVDETFLDYGIHAGTSMGLDKFTIYFYNYSGTRLNPGDINAQGNVQLFVWGLD